MSTPEEQQELEQQARAIEQWKIKSLVRKLENARGNGTSMISLIVPAKGQVRHT